MLDVKRISQIGKQQEMLKVMRSKADSTIPRRNELVKKAAELFSQIAMFSCYEQIAFVDFNSGELIWCYEVGELTIANLLEIVTNYTVGKFKSERCDNEPYTVAFCRKLEE